MHPYQIASSRPQVQVVDVWVSTATLSRPASGALTPTGSDQAAMTSCAAFGRQAAINSRRQAYHSQTSRGSRANAPGVARSSGRNRRQRPSCPRNVGTPLAADTPAPVRIVSRRAPLMRLASEIRSFSRNAQLPTPNAQNATRPSAHGSWESLTTSCPIGTRDGWRAPRSRRRARSPRARYCVRTIPAKSRSR